MINVQVRILFKTLDRKIHEPLKRRLLFFRIIGPNGLVLQIAAIARINVSKKIFQTLITGERITFEIQENIAFAWLG